MTRRLDSSFVMAPDPLLKKYGAIRAVVYGKIWKVSGSSESGTCRVAQGTLADEVGVHRSTFNKHMQALIEDGYLKDVTPDDDTLATRWIQPTDKLKFEGWAEGDRSSHPVEESDTPSRNGQQGVSKSTTPPVAESDTPKSSDSKESTKDSDPKNVGDGSKPDRPPRDEMNQIRKLAEDTWVAATGREIPASADQRERGKRWWTPLRKMCDDAHWDPDVIQWAIEMTAKRMDGLTFDAPDQTIKTYRSVLADAKRGQLRLPNDSQTRGAIRSYLNKRMDTDG